MNILITGVNGMLGSAIAAQLQNKHQITGTDIQDESLKNNDTEYFQCDITEESQVSKLSKHVAPEIIINCAAYTSVDGCEIESELAEKVNIDGLINILEIGHQNNSQVIQISTDYVFDGTDGPYTEYDQTNPVNKYGETKLKAELALIQSNLVWTIVRTNVLFSTNLDEPASFVSWVYQKLSSNEKINIVNDQYCNPTSVHHLAMAIDQIIEKDAHGIYHYAGKDYLNRFEFALQIADTFSLDNRLINKTTTRALGQKAPRPYKAGLKTDKIEDELHIQTFDLKDTLKSIKIPGDTE